MKLKRGSTSVRRKIFIADSSSTVGAGLTGLVYNSASLVCYYIADDLSNEVAVTLATATLGTWTSGGFVEVDATNMPGWYEIGIPNAALDGGIDCAIQLRGATNMVPVNIYIELDAFDYQTATQPVNVTQFGGTNGTFNSGVPTAELDSASVTAVQSGLATSSSVSTLQVAVDAITAIFTGMTSLPNWLRRAFRKDSGTAGMTTAQTEINNTGGAFTGTTDSLEAIRDNQSSSGGASLEDIISGVQSVSGAIVDAQNSATLSIRIGDTWTQDIGSLGDLTGKTVSFAMKKRASDADTAAIVFITEGTGLTRINGASTTAGWGSITINDEVAGDITLRLESDATSLLTSGSYVDAVKLLEDGDDRSPRNAGRTVVSAGVIADIT